MSAALVPENVATGQPSAKWRLNRYLKNILGGGQEPKSQMDLVGAALVYWRMAIDALESSCRHINKLFFTKRQKR